MHKVVVGILVLLLVCCKQPSPPKAQPNFKDSIIKKYLVFRDSDPFNDSIDYNYRILKAYMNNDSAFFVIMNKRIDQNIQALKEDAFFDSCAHQKQLSELNVDEAFRFVHSQPFCDFHQIITISRSKDAVLLYYVEFSNGEGHMTDFGNGIVIKPYCTIAKEFDKILSLTDWDNLEKKLDKADYWGLKLANCTLPISH